MNPEGLHRGGAGGTLGAMDATFALQVTVRLHPGKAPVFLPVIQRAARAAEELEPGCLAFHVGQSEEDPDLFVLFEVYRDAAALEFHHAQAHFARFREEAGEMIAEKVGVRLRL